MTGGAVTALWVQTDQNGMATSVYGGHSSGLALCSHPLAMRNWGGCDNALLSLFTCWEVTTTALCGGSRWQGTWWLPTWAIVGLSPASRAMATASIPAPR
jgi:hypothetical protein